MKEAPPEGRRDKKHHYPPWVVLLFRLLMGGAVWSPLPLGGVAFPLSFCVVLHGLLLLWVVLFFPSPLAWYCLPSLLWVVVLSPLRHLGWCLFFWNSTTKKG